MLLSNNINAFEYLENGLMDPLNNLSLIGKWSKNNSFLLSPFHNQYTLDWLINAFDALFHHFTEIKHIRIPKKSWQSQPALQDMIKVLNAESFSKYEFYCSKLVAHNDKKQILSNFNKEDLICPTRSLSPTGEVYRRFDHKLQQMISFKVVDIESDLALFHNWMHNPRVAEFWQQDWPEDELKQYLLNKLSTPITLPLIGYFNDQPFGYFEVYWAAEDHISEHYNWQAYDRGLHLLVGEESFRGKNYFASWLCAISHFIYQDDPQTQRIVLEPRADNHKLFNHILHYGFKKQYNFEFPHKTATLLMGHRETFFEKNLKC